MVDVFARFTLELDIKCEGLNPEEVIRHFKKVNPLAGFALHDDGSATGCIHWDTHDHDIIGFSKLYPADVIFCLTVESCVPISRDPDDNAWEITVKDGCDNYSEPVEEIERHKQWEAWMERSRAARKRF